jgi:hypothetical protein
MDDHDYGTNNGDSRFNIESKLVWNMSSFERSQQSRLDAHGGTTATGRGCLWVKSLTFRGLRGELLTDTRSWTRSSGFSVTSLLFYWDDPSQFFLLVNRSIKRLGRRDGFARLRGATSWGGESQWQWFEEAIGRSASVNIIIQGLRNFIRPLLYISMGRRWNAIP